MATEQSNSIAVNPYESPRIAMSALQGSALQGEPEGPPSPGVADWVATLLIWQQCAGCVMGSLAAVFEVIAKPPPSANTFFDGPPPLATVILVAPVVIAISSVVAYGQFRAIFKKESIWAGRVAVTVLGMGLVWVLVPICFAYWIVKAEGWEMLFVSLIGALYPLLLSYVMYRWYRRLKTYYSSSAAAKLS